MKCERCEVEFNTEISCTGGHVEAGPGLVVHTDKRCLATLKALLAQSGHDNEHMRKSHDVEITSLNAQLDEANERIDELQAVIDKPFTVPCSHDKLEWVCKWCASQQVSDAEHRAIEAEATVRDYQEGLKRTSEREANANARVEQLRKNLDDLCDEMNENAKHEGDKKTDFARGAAFAFREAVHACNVALADSEKTKE